MVPRLAALALLVSTLLGCRSARAVEPAADSTAAVRASLDELYRAFCFEPFGEPDWSAMEARFVDGAVFVAPFRAGDAPRAVRATEFLADFKRYVASDAVRTSGLHERILHARVDVFGVLSHAYVAFEGFEPRTQQVRTVGLDSLQLLFDRGRWRVVSFTTQYASDDAPLPPRFLAGR